MDLRARRGRPGGVQGRQGCVQRDPGAPRGATGRTDKICHLFPSKLTISGPGGHEIRGATHVLPRAGRGPVHGGGSAQRADPAMSEKTFLG